MAVVRVLTELLRIGPAQAAMAARLPLPVSILPAAVWTALWDRSNYLSRAVAAVRVAGSIISIKSAAAAAMAATFIVRGSRPTPADCS